MMGREPSSPSEYFIKEPWRWQIFWSRSVLTHRFDACTTVFSALIIYSGLIVAGKLQVGVSGATASEVRGTKKYSSEK